MSSDDTPVPEPREITDARTMRALAHPVRIALLDVLNVEGPLTATQAGELIGESPTTCSFHLRQLAHYGFVEEAGGGKGRARPWKKTEFGLRFSSVQDDPETEIAAMTLSRMYREQNLARLQQWLETSRSYPREWRNAGNSTEFVLWLTSEELADLNEQLIELLRVRARERNDDPSARPKGSLPVELLMFSYPMQPPREEPRS